MTTISQERAALAKVGRSLRTREQWGSRYGYTDARAVTEPARFQFVHISITNPRNYGSDDAHARAIEAIGASRFPSTKISYNRLHFQSGRAMEGQPVGRRGAHTVNDKGLSACVTSGCPSRGGKFTGTTNLNYTARAYVICQNVGDTVTDAELDSLARSLAADRLAGFVTRDAAIHGHRCVAYKDCPAAKMWARMGELKKLVAHYVAVGFTTPKPSTPPQEDEMSAAEVATGVEAGMREYVRDFYTVGQGTGWRMHEENRADAKAIVEATKTASDANVKALGELTAAVKALTEAVTPKA